MSPSFVFLRQTGGGECGGGGVRGILGAAFWNTTVLEAQNVMALAGISGQHRTQLVVVDGTLTADD